MPVKTPLKEYENELPRWSLVRDVMKNDIRKPIYVPDIDPNSIYRSEQYRLNGVINNFSKRTRDALIGSLFRYDPKITLPTALDYLNENANGNHLGLIQQAEDLCGDLLETGRVGILVDFPMLDRSPTKSELLQGKISAKLIDVRAEQLIKWRVQSIDGNLMTTLLVIRETETVEENMFDWKNVPVYRVCALIEGIYNQAMFDDDNKQITDWFPVLDADGKPWDRIPFHPGGAINNDLTIDLAPLLDLAELNIAYYRNSCAHEDYIKFLNGGLAVIKSDMNKDTFEQKNPGKKLYWGSRSVYMIGSGDSIDLIQGKDTDSSLTGMMNKIEMAIGLGAKLIVPASGVETAEAASIRNASENSVLMNVANNGQEMIRKAMNDCGRFMIRGFNEDRDLVEFELSRQFYERPINPQLLMAQIQLLDRKAISLQVLRDNLRKHDVIPKDMTNDEIDEQIMETEDLISFDTDINTDDNLDNNQDNNADE